MRAHTGLAEKTGMVTSQRISPEDLLWDLAVEAPDGETAPSDEILEAYRSGRLPAGEASRLERLLARSQAGRRRLAALAGIARPEPRSTVRERVLAKLNRLKRAGSASRDGAARTRRRCRPASGLL